MSTALVINGDARHIPLPDASVQTCVTSPPYFGLRNYETAGQIGLEQTPDAYVAELVRVFRDVHRVLTDDGTLWLNLGDSYARQAGDDSTKVTDGGIKSGRNGRSAMFKTGCNTPPPGLKPKDLIGIPWRVAFALQAEGWYLRSDIIWAKPNPMPESVTDRPTKAHEYVFLFAKSAKYYYNHEAVKEPCSADMQARAAKGHTRGAKGKLDASRHDAATLRGEQARTIDVSKGRNRRSVWTITPKPFRGAHFAVFPEALVEPCVQAGSRKGDLVLDPFGGSGTTGLVAQRLERYAVLVERNPDYCRMARERLDGADAAR